MTDTLQNIVLPAGVWVDLYADPVVSGAGITAGTKIGIKNHGKSELHLHAGADAPIESDGFVPVRLYEYAENEAGDSGAWAMSKGANGLINVREV